MLSFYSFFVGILNGKVMQGKLWVLGEKRKVNMVVSGECNLFSSVLSQQKFEAIDVKALGRSQLLDSPCYSSRADQFYLENKGKYVLEA